jgi:hypothetical protein
VIVKLCGFRKGCDEPGTRHDCAVVFYNVQPLFKFMVGTQAYASQTHPSPVEMTPLCGDFHTPLP